MLSQLRSVLLVLVAFLIVGAFGATVALADNSTLVIGTGSEATTLDPRLATDVASAERIYTIMQPLMGFRTDMSLYPILARSWEFGDDGLSITFHLEKGVKFHHGLEFTAKDVKYTFEWILDENNPARDRQLYTDISEIEIVDDYTIVFHLHEPNGFLINNIARMNIVPHDRGEDPDFGRNPVGTGPYMFESWRRDDQLVLRAFDDFWQGRAYIDTIVFRPIPETSAKLLAFEAGEIDLYQDGIVHAELPRLEADPRFVVLRTPGVGYEYLGINSTKGVLGDKRVRQALSHLINREGMVDVVLNGVGRPGISMIAPQLPWFNPDVRRYEYDPDKARALFAEAGIDPQGLKMTLHTSEVPVRMLLAEILEFELSQFGIELTVIIEEGSTFLRRLRETDDYELFISSWSGQLDPDRAMSRQFHSEGAANYGRYSNPRVDELLDLGRVTPADSPESIAIYGEAQAIVVEEVPFAFITYAEEVGLHHAYIEGWEVHPHASAAYQNVHRVTKNK